MDSGDMALMAATLNDPAKAARLEEIMAAQKRADDTMARAQDMQTSAETILADANKIHVQGLDALKAANGKAADLVKQEKLLGKSNDALQAEKGNFEKVREAVRKEHHDRNASLIFRQIGVEKREREVAMREAGVADRDAYLVATKESLERKHERLRLALADNDAEG